MLRYKGIFTWNYFHLPMLLLWIPSLLLSTFTFTRMSGYIQLMLLTSTRYNCAWTHKLASLCSTISRGRRTTTIDILYLLP